MIILLIVAFLYGSVWNPGSTKERKKNVEENDFLMFGSKWKNIKENQI